MLPATKNLIVLVVWTYILLFILLTYYQNDFRHFFNFPKSSNPIKLENDELLLFDNSNLPNQKELIAAITQREKPLQKSKNCVKFPSVPELKYHNKHWQTFVMRNMTFELYNAYYDTRPTFTGGPSVRVLVKSNETIFTNQTIYCQLWYDNSLQPDITKAIVLRSIWALIWGKSGKRLFQLSITCPLAQSNQGTPKNVSLVAKECDTATNFLHILYDKHKNAYPNDTKSKFAICIKAMNFPHSDISAYLVEWIELQFILGASKMFFYQLEMHPNVTKVLEYYKRRDLVDVIPMTFAYGKHSLAKLQRYLINKQISKKRLNELITYNDCFYRNIYKFDYISIQDIDEVLMPLGNLTNWSELMKRGAQIRPKGCDNGYVSYCLRNVYFSSPHISAPHASDIPQRNTTLVRADYNIKCFHRTDLVIRLQNLVVPRSWLKVCKSTEFDVDVAQVQNFTELPILDNTVIDESIRRYKDELLQRSVDALRAMGFIHKAIKGS